MGIRCYLIIFCVILMPFVKAIIPDSRYSNSKKGYIRKNDEYMDNERFIQQLAKFRVFMRDAQLFRELQSKRESNIYPPRISRACYFSPVQCLLMKKEGGMNDLIKIGQAYDVMSSNQSPQLEFAISNSNFGRGWRLPRRYKPR